MQPFLCPKDTTTLILETAYLSVWNHTMTKTHGRNMKKHKDLIEVHKSTSWLHTPPQSDSCPVVPTGSSHRHWGERLLERPCCGGERSSSGGHAKATDGHFCSLHWGASSCHVHSRGVLADRLPLSGFSIKAVQSIGVVVHQRN